MDKIFAHALLASSVAALAYFVYWSYKDIKREKRPPVTDDMVEEAFNKMLNDGAYYLD